MSRRALPRLVGVIHLPALPGSANFAGDPEAVIASAAREAALLAEHGFDGMMIENFGDVPFSRGRVDAVTVASMTACARAARDAAPKLALGINVLRNDADAALAVAAVAGGDMLRINVHMGARVTDQGVIEGRAHETLRERRRLGLDEVALLCDVAVKHSSALGEPRPIVEEAAELSQRGAADAVLVTGSGTGRAASDEDIHAVAEAIDVPVYVASGVTRDRIASLGAAYGVIVGSALRVGGKAGEAIDAECAARFADAFHAERSPS
jgi:membrane complex biogenesis BtpA family protein